MRFFKEIRFPGDLDAVVSMLTNPDFRAEVAEAVGAESYEVSVEETDEGVLCVLETVSPTSGFPAAAQTFLGPSMDIRQEELWTSSTRGRLSVVMPGKPGHVSGSASLREDGDAVVQTIDAEVTVRLFLVGAKVEAVIGSAMGKILKVQESVGGDWLTRT